jgi:glycosyltransferase involved in cell wall biosynthesis
MISVVIPAFNEEGAIVKTIEDARKALDEWEHADEYEIIVVDDGSTDRTGELASELGAQVIRHPTNAGYGRSVKNGIAAAKHDVIAITDADGTYPLDCIPSLVAEFLKGFDMVVGARTGREYRESFFKSPMRRLLRLLVEFTTGRQIQDINSGLRVFRRSSINEYLGNLCDTFSFTTSLTLIYMHTGKYISYIEIPYYKRIGQSKVRLIRDSLITLQFVVQLILLFNPIKLFIVISLFFIVFSVVLFLYYLASGTETFFVLSVEGLFVSVIVFCMGLLGELLRQVFVRLRSSDEDSWPGTDD